MTVCLASVPVTQAGLVARSPAGAGQTQGEMTMKIWIVHLSPTDIAQEGTRCFFKTEAEAWKFYRVQVRKHWEDAKEKYLSDKNYYRNQGERFLQNPPKYRDSYNECDAVTPYFRQISSSPTKQQIIDFLSAL